MMRPARELNHSLPLNDAKHEHFARLLALLIPPQEAALLAGIAARNAVRLGKRPDIRKRVRALEDTPISLTVGQALAVASRLFECARKTVCGQVEDFDGGTWRRRSGGAVRRLGASVSPRKRR